MRARRTVSVLAWTTLVLVYLVILAGSIVRSTGSGMGCPDWPKCFGQWIPPTSVDQLPADYEAQFLEGRKVKLDKYIRLIESIGLPQTAEAMRNDPSLLASEPFDARGTWIEYVNRLFGFLAGNAMLALVIASLWTWRWNKWIPIISLIALIAIVFQAWLGSVVVATNLLPWTITIHMVVAFLIIALLLSVISRTSKDTSKESFQLKGVLVLAIILTLVQVVLGTQVRQEVDQIAKMFADRSEWIEQLSSRFEIHRSFSILLVLVNGAFLWKNRAYWNNGILRALGLFLVLEILVGMTLAYLGMPAVAQPTHLLLATIFFGIQCKAYFSR
jgi:cytochrome c oxidase assembly protein subunit 15